jgi:hypothetical protein
MELNSNTIERMYEISFYNIMQNINKNVGNEKIDFLLEHLCIAFEVDYTSISILKNMYTRKLAPTKREVAIYLKVTQTPMERMPIDYRTYRKYVKQWELTGSVNLNPVVYNNFLKPVIKSFVDKYINLMYDELSYIKRITLLTSN